MPASKGNRDQRASSLPDGASYVDEIWELYGIGKSTFYERLHVLKIKPVKLEGWAYLTKEQLALFDELDKHLKIDGRYKTFRKIRERQDAPKEVVNSDAAPKVSVNEVEKAPSTAPQPPSPHSQKPRQRQVPPYAPYPTQQPLYRIVQRPIPSTPTKQPGSPETQRLHSFLTTVAMGLIILGLLQSHQLDNQLKQIQMWWNSMIESISGEPRAL